MFLMLKYRVARTCCAWMSPCSTAPGPEDEKACEEARLEPTHATLSLSCAHGRYRLDKAAESKLCEVLAKWDEDKQYRPTVEHGTHSLHLVCSSDDAADRFQVLQRPLEGAG